MSDLTSPSITAVRDLREASCGPIGAPAVTSDLSENVILTSLDDLHNWARLSTLALLYGTPAASSNLRHCWDRASISTSVWCLAVRPARPIADRRWHGDHENGACPGRLYEQMPEPKYVIAMGACTITGGMFSADSTTAVRGVDKLIPADLYMPAVHPGRKRSLM